MGHSSLNLQSCMKLASATQHHIVVIAIVASIISVSVMSLFANSAISHSLFSRLICSFWLSVLSLYLFSQYLTKATLTDLTSEVYGIFTRISKDYSADRTMLVSQGTPLFDGGLSDMGHDSIADVGFQGDDPGLGAYEKAQDARFTSAAESVRKEGKKTNPKLNMSRSYFNLHLA